jgi:hypothetical protein
MYGGLAVLAETPWANGSRTGAIAWFSTVVAIGSIPSIEPCVTQCVAARMLEACLGPPICKKMALTIGEVSRRTAAAKQPGDLPSGVTLQRPGGTPERIAVTF